jgi:hypothetical protein
VFLLIAVSTGGGGHNLISFELQRVVCLKASKVNGTDIFFLVRGQLCANGMTPFDILRLVQHWVCLTYVYLKVLSSEF